MTDTFDKGSAAFIAKRYSSERRFKAYGAAALAVSVLFLVYLIVDIGIKAWPSFFEHRAVLEINMDPGKVPANDVLKGDFEGLVKDGFRSLFPGVSERRDVRSLTSLLSAGAADDLRRQTAANPATIGTTVRAGALLAANADMYLKGMLTQTLRTAGTTTLQLAQTGEEFIFTGDLSQLATGQIVRANGGALRIASLEPGLAKAEAIVPPATLNTLTSGTWDILTFSQAEADRRIDDKQVVWLESLRDKGAIEKHFAWRFFTSGDSREPELAGLRGAIFGSLLTLIMTLSLSVPLGIAAAVYLEEFAAKNKWTEVIEVNINNLAAVPSIIFGLLGLAVFINFFGLPRSAPLVGGLVLALLVLPTIIIASRAALKAVPPSIKEAALGVGASHQQAVFHHVLPLAVPGILTGTILGVARALGETAPLLMIGMVAFIVDIPKGFTESATVLPVQIFLWSDLPEVAFQSRTAAAIIVLLVILFCLNAVAIYMRKRFERRW
ncbi:MAG: phosphate ABC transporter permease PstA [Aestuariivirga sp.]